jgi:hypothetical protein
MLLIILFVILAGISKYYLDWHSENTKTETSNNKYLMFFGKPIDYTKKWYHFGFYPKYEENFIYSTTILVFLTDPWHRWQFIMYKFLWLALWSAIELHYEFHWSMWVIAPFIILPIINGFAFEVTKEFKKL